MEISRRKYGSEAAQRAVLQNKMRQYELNFKAMS